MYWPPVLTPVPDKKPFSTSATRTRISFFQSFETRTRIEIKRILAITFENAILLVSQIFLILTCSHSLTDKSGRLPTQIHYPNNQLQPIVRLFRGPLIWSKTLESKHQGSQFTKVCAVELILLWTGVSSSRWQVSTVRTQQLLTLATTVLPFFFNLVLPPTTNTGKEIEIRHWPKLTLTINDFVDKTELVSLSKSNCCLLRKIKISPSISGNIPWYSC